MGDLLTILVFDRDPLRAAVIEAGLREAGHRQVRVVTETQGLMRVIADAEPDVIVFDLQAPDRDQAEHFFAISRHARRPVAMFVDHAEGEMMEAAIAAGVSAYVVDGLRQDRVKPILDMAIARYRAFEKMRDELEATRRKLDESRFIGRAKAMIMKKRGVDEDEAHRLLRRAAMARGRRLGELAQAMVEAATVLEGEEE